MEDIEPVIESHRNCIEHDGIQLELGLISLSLVWHAVTWATGSRRKSGRVWGAPLMTSFQNRNPVEVSGSLWKQQSPYVAFTGLGNSCWSVLLSCNFDSFSLSVFQSFSFALSTSTPRHSCSGVMRIIGLVNAECPWVHLGSVAHHRGQVEVLQRNKLNLARLSWTSAKTCEIHKWIDSFRRTWWTWWTSCC